MTSSMAIGLSMQAAALWIMHVGIRGRWLGHVGALYLAAAVCYHGLTEIMQMSYPDGRFSYRDLISQPQLDDWMLIASTALLLYSIAYVFLIRRKRSVVPVFSPAYVSGLKAKWLIFAAVPLLALTVSGSTATGFQENQTNKFKDGSDYVLGGVSSTFMIVLVAVAGTALVVTKGPRWAVPTLLTECAVLALGGDRRSILFVCLITLYGLTITGVKLPRKSLVMGLAAAAVLVFSISASRAVVGREQFFAGQGAGARSSALVAGSDALGSSAGWAAIREDTVYRLDGNTYGTVINAQIGRGFPTVGFVTLKNNFILAVPSFLFPGKQQTALEVRSEKANLNARYFTSTTDFIPGALGFGIAYFGRFGLLLVGLLLGCVFAGIDRFVFKSATAPRLVFGAGMLLPALLYESGVAGILTLGRGAVALALLIWAILHLIKKRKTILSERRTVSLGA